MAQAERAAPEAQPVRAIQSPFDFHLRSAQTRADFFPWHAPAVSLPADGVIIRHLARDAHTQDFFQAVFSPQPPMGIAWLRGSTVKRCSQSGRKRISKK